MVDMDLFVVIVVFIIFAETSYLTFKSSGRTVTKGHQRRQVFVDTSVLMDGRVLSVAKTGFIGDDLMIPRSVIRELQLLADGKDSEKRSRARFGLDVANELERLEDCEVKIFQDELDRSLVDERLIELAKKNDGVILTNDYNLNKVAQTEGIQVLNINDLAMVLRSEFLPGDRFTLQLTMAGSNPKQGIGHLPDGTMVVVENGLNRLGQTVEIEFVRYLQTAAGRMMFARLAPTSSSKGRERKNAKK